MPEEVPQEPEVTPPQPPADPAAVAACEAELSKEGVKFTVGENIPGAGACGVYRPIHLETLPGNVEVSGKPTVTCAVAQSLAQWMKEVVVPSALLHLKAHPSVLHIATSYQCRNRNNASKGKISEHAFGNAVDILGISFAERGDVDVAVRIDDSTPDRAFQAAIRGGACAFFTTVLGPTTNAAHASHFHLDMIRRRNGYRLCE